MLVQRMNFLSMVQELAQRDVERCVEVMGLDALLLKDDITGKGPQQPSSRPQQPAAVVVENRLQASAAARQTQSSAAKLRQSPKPQETEERNVRTTETQTPPKAKPKAKRRQQQIPPSSRPYPVAYDDGGHPYYPQPNYQTYPGGYQQEQQQFQQQQQWYRGQAPPQSNYRPQSHEQAAQRRPPSSELTAEQKAKAAELIANLQLSGRLGKSMTNDGVQTQEARNRSAGTSPVKVRNTGAGDSRLPSPLRPGSRQQSGSYEQQRPDSRPRSAMKGTSAPTGDKKTLSLDPNAIAREQQHGAADVLTLSSPEEAAGSRPGSRRGSKPTSPQQAAGSPGANSGEHSRPSSRSEAIRQFHEERVMQREAEMAMAANVGGAVVRSGGTGLSDEERQSLIDALTQMEEEQGVIAERAAAIAQKSALRIAQDRPKVSETSVPKPTTAPPKSRRLRGTIPPEMIKSIRENKENVSEYVRYNEKLWNNSGVSQFVFAQRLTHALLTDLVDEVLDEVTSVLDQYVDGLVDYELQ